MRVIDPGHIYEVDVLDGISQPTFRQIITFVKREGKGYPGNVGYHPGTNLQEMWRSDIDRLKYLNRQIPWDGNNLIIWDLRRAIQRLEMRAAERHGREWVNPTTDLIEQIETCRFCGHIACHGTCHK